MCIFSLLSVFMGTYAWFESRRTVESTTDNFNVSKVQSGIATMAVHDFYGSTLDGSAFGFNPTANHTITWSGQSGTDTGSFTMGTFSLDDPHHPVMFLLGLSGTNATVNLKTEAPYLAISKPGGSLAAGYIFSSYAAMDVAGNKIEGNNGQYFEVTHDEHQGSYVDNNKNNTFDGDDYYVTTRYIYNHTTQTFERVWSDLATDDNPLSSVIQAHWVLFSGDPTTSTSSGDLYTGGTGTYRSSYISVSTDFGNTSYFTNFPNGNPNPRKEMQVFNGSTAGYTHLGIIIDYNPASLEYLYSYFLGHAFLNSGLRFKCDWSMEF